MTTELLNIPLRSLLRNEGAHVAYASGLRTHRFHVPGRRVSTNSEHGQRGNVALVGKFFLQSIGWRTMLEPACLPCNRTRTLSLVKLMRCTYISALLTADIPVIYFSFGNWFRGMTQPVGLKNIMWRREQFRSADRPAFCLHLARQLVVGKIRNQRTMLMRNHVEPPRKAVSFMKEMAGDAGRCNDLAQLLGVEGIAARCYFENFGGMLKKSTENDESNALVDAKDFQQTFRFDFKKRNRRPPRDPVNALLSLGYSVLSKDLTIACASVGLDPYLGFYHQPRFGRPALALDLMEPFRPLIVESLSQLF